MSLAAWSPGKSPILKIESELFVEATFSSRARDPMSASSMISLR